MENLQNKEFLLRRIIKAALESPEFKEKLKRNPKDIFESQVKFQFPDDFEVVVHEDTPKRINIVLPYHSEELSEVELSAVSGGVCWENCNCG